MGCFLTGVWAHNVVFSRKIAFYIRDKIEPKLEGLNWETATEKERFSIVNVTGAISTSGIFITTQLIAIILGLLKTTFTTIDIVLISMDGAAFLTSLLMVRFAMQQYKSIRQ